MKYLKEIVEIIVDGVVTVLLNPLGWIGLLCLSTVLMMWPK